ncbi:MAG: ABC transporter substrate-binding protein [Rhodospirillum sp.]|nr:ABC transporter substrate-binding protein [Rhodospirillum sp.]MCF8490247.1 ABC transporter substrate-binding protein [Rhodospirillum sp.]MCF8501256.1 ABC transporter substrate-binding protein [Rhodospirillum sp.]
MRLSSRGESRRLWGARLAVGMLLGGLSSRGAVARLSTVPLLGGASSTDERLVVLDWGLAETVLALGVTPLGVPAPGWYDRYVGGGETMPSGVTNVGLLFAPNFELIQSLAPSRILITPGLTAARSALDRIAPTDSFTVFRPGADVLDHAREETWRLADRIGRARSRDALFAGVDRSLDRARRAVAESASRPLYLVTVIDDRHVRIHGRESLYGGVLTRLGLRNAWKRPTLGGVATVALDALLEEPEAGLVTIATPFGGGLGGGHAQGPFWSILPFAREGRVYETAPVLANGGLPSVARFARLLARALDTTKGHAR